MPDDPDHGPRSDSELVRAINAGDEAAFAALYHRHKDWALGLAYRFTGRHADALDVVQETFLYLARKFPGFSLTASMTTFLYPVIKNIALSDLRQRRRGGAAKLEGMDPPAPAVAAASAEGVIAAVARLPEGQREVVLMRFVHDMSMEEIAAALKIPAGTVKSRLHHALATLRDDPRVRQYLDSS